MSEKTARQMINNNRTITESYRTAAQMPTKETTRNGRNAAETLNGWAALTDNTKLLFHNKKFMCISHVGGAVQPKGNGISPEGCRKMRLIFAKHSLIFSALCRSLLVGCFWLCALARRSIFAH